MSEKRPDEEGLSDEQVKDWMKRIQFPETEEDKLYEEHIHKAAESGDETALQFVRRAAEIDPAFVKINFPYLDEESDK